jgi:fructose-1,6-bisphosphatase/sedoheptulose 1,7-bisphosphatase-like protein
MLATKEHQFIELALIRQMSAPVQLAQPSCTTKLAAVAFAKCAVCSLADITVIQVERQRGDERLCACTDIGAKALAIAAKQLQCSSPTANARSRRCLLQH